MQPSPNTGPQMTSSVEVAEIAEVHERLQRVKAVLTAPATTSN